MTDNPISAFSRTHTALAVVFDRRDTLIVFVSTFMIYFLLYTVMTNAVALSGNAGLSVTVVADPFARFMEPMGYLSFEPVARVETTVFTYLFSPIDAGIAVLLAGLVAANGALTYLGLVQPEACGLASSSGVFAGVPALFSGAACCGPLLFATIGIQATGTLLTAFRWLVPVAIAALLVGLWAIGRQIDPGIR